MLGMNFALSAKIICPAPCPPVVQSYSAVEMGSQIPIANRDPLEGHQVLVAEC